MRRADRLRRACRVATAGRMTGRFVHFDARSCGSYRLVLAYADASAAREVRRRLRRGRRHGRSPRRRPMTRRHQGPTMCPTGSTLQITRRDCPLRWTISPLPLNAERRLPRSHGARRYGDHPCRSDAEGQIYGRQLLQAGDYTGPHRDRSGFAKAHERVLEWFFRYWRASTAMHAHASRVLHCRASRPAVIRIVRPLDEASCGTVAANSAWSRGRRPPADGHSSGGPTMSNPYRRASSFTRSRS
jgi:hypothetical protein